MYTIYNENNNIKVCTFNDKNLFLSRVLTSVSEFVNQSSYAVLVSFLFLLSSMNQEQVHLNIQLHSLVINSINWNVLWVTHFFVRISSWNLQRRGKACIIKGALLLEIDPWLYQYHSHSMKISFIRWKRFWAGRVEASSNSG